VLTYSLVLAFSFHIFLLKFLIQNEHACNIGMKYEYANILVIIPYKHILVLETHRSKISWRPHKLIATLIFFGRNHGPLDKRNLGD